MAEHYDEDGYFTAYQSGPIQERSAPVASDFADRVPEPRPFNGILNYIRIEEEKVTMAWCGLPHADPRVPFGKVRWLVLGKDGKMYAYCAERVCAEEAQIDSGHSENQNRRKTDHEHVDR